MAYLLLFVSILLSTGRNLFSKKLSGVRFGTRAFFRSQSCLFLFGGIALAPACRGLLDGIARQTLLYAATYSLLLILAQWFYTAALAKGNTALCSTVYSLGFILPTLSGAILWGETFSALNAMGILCAGAAVVLSGQKPFGNKISSVWHDLLPILIAMTASGGLGIMQKLQQKSAYAEQKPIFLLVAFLLAATVSLLFSLFVKQDAERLAPKQITVAACIGLFFGICNLLNTSLSGMLESAVFFPTLNIGVIVLSMLCGLLFFKERLSPKALAVLILGSASILLLTIG